MTVQELIDQLKQVEPDREVQLFVGSSSYVINDELLIVNNAHKVLIEVYRPPWSDEEMK